MMEYASYLGFFMVFMIMTTLMVKILKSTSEIMTVIGIIAMLICGYFITRIATPKSETPAETG